MKITAVSMRVVNREKVKAFASITIDDEFVVHDLRIIEGQKGLFVAMPSRKLPNGEFRDVAHPIKPEVREMIQTTVLKDYEERKDEHPQEALPEEAVSAEMTDTHTSALEPQEEETPAPETAGHEAGPELEAPEEETQES